VAQGLLYSGTEKTAESVRLNTATPYILFNPFFNFYSGEPMNTQTAKKILAVLATGVMLLAGAVTAGAAESWQFHDIVEADFVIAHISVPMADNVMIIDSRPYKPMYIKGHIPGAVSIPDTEFDKKSRGPWV
jgi:hypothetical protein